MKEQRLLTVSFNSSLDFMETSHKLVEQVLQLADFSEDDIYWLTIAAREAIANAIKHGNQMNLEKKVFLELCLLGDVFVMKVTDQGKGFDPESIPDPRDPENLLKGGGRGIYYMKTFLDEVEYKFAEDGATTVIMKKHRQ
jgi:serine/threonine-protein kinase RsbW